MKKSKPINQLRTLEFKKETIMILAEDQLRAIVGGNQTTRPSQCPTMCF